MARFLFTVWPFPGHIHPNIAVAHALRNRGHEIAFYTGALYRPILEQEGFVVFPFDRLAQRMRAMAGLPENAPEPVLYRRWIDYQSRPFKYPWPIRGLQLGAIYRASILGTAPQQVADLQSIVGSWRPDGIVCDPDMWGPILILHPLATIPVAVLSYYATSMIPGGNAPPAGFGLPASPALLARLLARGARLATDLVMMPTRRDAALLRHRFGLPPLSMRIYESMARLPLYLVTSAPEFDYPRNDLPSSVHYVGPCLWDKPRDEPAPRWLGELPRDKPLVYVSEGTTYTHTPVILEAAVRGLAGRPMHVVITIGRHRDSSEIAGYDADNVHTESWVPVGDVMARASVAVTHGGATSTLSALSAGVPVVVVPLQWEQKDTAQRVVAFGAGVWLARRDCTPQRLRAAVEAVLGTPRFRERAQELAAALASRGGPLRAATLLEGMACPTPLPQGVAPGTRTEKESRNDALR